MKRRGGTEREGRERTEGKEEENGRREKRWEKRERRKGRDKGLEITFRLVPALPLSLDCVASSLFAAMAMSIASWMNPATWSMSASFRPRLVSAGVPGGRCRVGLDTLC